MRRLFPHPVLSGVLLVVWLLLNNSLSVGQMVMGALMATFIPWMTSQFWPERYQIESGRKLISFLLLVLYDIVVANITVAKLILGPTQRLKPGFLRIPLDVEHSLGMSILANTISLTPGTVSCDLSEDRRWLLVHALHVEDCDAAIVSIKTRYEKPIMEVFSACSN